MTALLYNIINPSDPVTMLAPSFEAAAIATLLVGDGQYAAEPIGHDGERVPIFLFGGFDAWFADRFPGTDFAKLIADHRGPAIEALRSFVTGSPSDRQLRDAALAAIDDEQKRAAFDAEWEDRKRSSLNAITARAHAIADHLATKPAEEVTQ